MENLLGIEYKIGSYIGKDWREILRQDNELKDCICPIKIKIRNYILVPVGPGRYRKVKPDPRQIHLLASISFWMSQEVLDEIDAIIGRYVQQPMSNDVLKNVQCDIQRIVEYRWLDGIQMEGDEEHSLQVRMSKYFDSYPENEYI